MVGWLYSNTNKVQNKSCKRTIKGFLDYMEEILTPNYSTKYYFGIPAPTKGKEFLEYYASVGISLPADIGLSYYYGFSPTGYSQNYDYTYHNIYWYTVKYNHMYISTEGYIFI